MQEANIIWLNMKCVLHILWIEKTKSQIAVRLFGLWGASRFSHIRLFATPWMVAHQVPLSMGFSEQEYCSGLPCLPLGDLPDPGMKPESSASPELWADSLLLSLLGSLFVSLPLSKVSPRYQAHTSSYFWWIEVHQLMYVNKIRIYEGESTTTFPTKVWGCPKKEKDPIRRMCIAISDPRVTN